jgi:hypothetical protein
MPWNKNKKASEIYREKLLTFRKFKSRKTRDITSFMFQKN